MAAPQEDVQGGTEESQVEVKVGKVVVEQKMGRTHVEVEVRKLEEERKVVRTQV